MLTIQPKNQPRRNAYELVNKNGEWTDTKGGWCISGLYRTLRHGRPEYEARVTFNPGPDTRIKCRESKYGYAYYDESRYWKRRVKAAIGYIPSNDTLSAMIDYLELLKAAYEEEDQYYAAQDKAAASKRVEEIFELAMARYGLGQSMKSHASDKMKRLLEEYVTAEERLELHELYKIQNGSSYLEDVRPFMVRLCNAVREEMSKREQQAKRDRSLWLRQRLEVDVSLRHLVAHVHAAAIHKYRGYDHWSLFRETAYQLFGYAKNQNDYRDRAGQLTERLSPYQLKDYEINELLRIGKEYIQDGGQLPIVEVPFNRSAEDYYYGDAVLWGGKSYSINRIGRKYLYLSGGSRILKPKLNIA
ncbi:hypothetical protein ACFQZE_23880 [Paenibacillus sp. GCM10027627]|uniref:hypothetical protein n=1 Tax=unclassified Paenibacillus TaxID=185978 RepID=UPI00363AD673